jgi:hypothetical protein
MTNFTGILIRDEKNLIRDAWIFRWLGYVVVFTIFKERELNGNTI